MYRDELVSVFADFSYLYVYLYIYIYIYILSIHTIEYDILLYNGTIHSILLNVCVCVRAYASGSGSALLIDYYNILQNNLLYYNQHTIIYYII